MKSKHIISLFTAEILPNHDLGECFERNAEGMLKNMTIHEIALLVSFYDVSVLKEFLNSRWIGLG